MPTKNRRVATYLPEELEEVFNQFKEDRQLGDSQALMVILREFFGVSQPVSQSVAHSSSAFVTLERFEELVSQVDELSRRIEAFLEVPKTPRGELSSDSLTELLMTESPGQLKLLPDDVLQQKVQDSESSGGSSTEPPDGGSVGLSPLRAMDLSRRLGLSSKAIGGAKHRFKGDLDKLRDWIREHDPDDVVWEYNPTDKLFYPVEPDF